MWLRMGLFCAMVVWDANNRAMPSDKEQNIFFMLVTIVPEVSETIIIGGMQNCRAADGRYSITFFKCEIHFFDLPVAVPGLKLPIGD